MKYEERLRYFFAVFPSEYFSSIDRARDQAIIFLTFADDLIVAMREV